MVATHGSEWICFRPRGSPPRRIAGTPLGLGISARSIVGYIAAFDVRDGGYRIWRVGIYCVAGLSAADIAPHGKTKRTVTQSRRSVIFRASGEVSREPREA